MYVRSYNTHIVGTNYTYVFYVHNYKLGHSKEVFSISKVEIDKLIVISKLVISKIVISNCISM